MQAQEIVCHLLDNFKPAQTYLFPGDRSLQQRISENTLNKALHRMGYADQLTGHGISCKAENPLGMTIIIVFYQKSLDKALGKRYFFQISFKNKQRDTIANLIIIVGTIRMWFAISTYIITNIDARTFIVQDIGNVGRTCVMYAGSKIGTITELERSM